MSKPLKLPFLPQAIEQVAVTALVPYARNARVHNATQVEKLARSIQTYGFTVPVLIDADGGIVAGHGRVMAAKKLGLSKVPCIRVGHMTPAQKRAYIVADNRIAELAEWDADLLSTELSELKSLGSFDLTLTAFDDAEIMALLPQAPDPALIAGRGTYAQEAAGGEESGGDDDEGGGAEGQNESMSDAVAAASASSTGGGNRIPGSEPLTVVGYCESYAQQLDGANALRALGIRVDTK